MVCIKGLIHPLLEESVGGVRICIDYPPGLKFDQIGDAAKVNRFQSDILIEGTGDISIYCDIDLYLFVGFGISVGKTQHLPVTKEYIKTSHAGCFTKKNESALKWMTQSPTV